MCVVVVVVGFCWSVRGGVCFKLGQLSGISIVDKERPFSYAAMLLLLLLLLLCCCCCWRLAVVVCVLNLGQLSGIFAVAVAVVAVVVRVVVVVGGGGACVCFKLGQLSGISIVDKERPFRYAAAVAVFCCCLCCCCCWRWWCCVFLN